MAELGKSDGPVAPLEPDGDPAALIEALRKQGAARFDPVGFRFIEALARRAPAQAETARLVLDGRLAEALAEYGGRFERAARAARDALERGTARFPEAAETLAQHCEAGDFGALHRLLARLEARAHGGALAGLLAYIGRHTAAAADGDAADAVATASAAHGELKSVAYFRSTWSRLSLDRQLSHAFAQAPENAGPLNSHFLVLQALRLMRDVSPAYLEQFVSYVDALLWLEQAEGGRGPAPKNPARGEREKKRKSGRGNAA